MNTLLVGAMADEIYDIPFTNLQSVQIAEWNKLHIIHIIKTAVQGGQEFHSVAVVSKSRKSGFCSVSSINYAAEMKGVLPSSGEFKIIFVMSF